MTSRYTVPNRYIIVFDAEGYFMFIKSSENGKK